MSAPIPYSTRERIRRAYRQGVAVDALVERFRVSRRLIFYIVKSGIDTCAPQQDRAEHSTGGA